MVGVGLNKVVATLRADGKVYPTEGTSIGQLANLINYKIRTETERAVKSLNTLSVPTTVVDLGKQMLQYARDNDVKGVKYMLSRGAPFTSDWLGMSALHFGAMNNEYEICDALLKGGINKDWKTKVDRTPLHFACFYGNEQIVELLLSRKCAVNPKDMLRMTPLHWAIEKRFKGIVRLLLKYNADVTCLSKFEKTPIALAVLTEQADLLEELEAARQSQINKKFSEETEKETSDAVNSIMQLKGDVIEEPSSIRQMNLDVEDDLTNQSDFIDVEIADLASCKETGTLDDNTINLLKSHGISMMTEDNDTSKDLLNVALKNGRQLILSEGGKLLLNEARLIQQPNQSIKNNKNIIINNNDICNNNNFAISKSDLLNATVTAAPPTVTNKVPPLNKIRPNVLTKAKNTANGNKNIRIISLNDFKKFYGSSANMKTLQNISQPRMVAQMSSTEDAEQKMFANLRKIQQSQMTVPHSAATQSIAKIEDNLRDDEDGIDPMSSIIQVIPTESEVEAPDNDHRQTKSGAATVTPPLRLINTAIGNLSARRLVDIRPVLSQTKQTGTAQTSNNSSQHSQGCELPITKKPAAKHQQHQSPTVIPLLTTPEICRQLFELRKQNEDLRRKFEFAQKEKEHMQQRLERMEEFLLIDNDKDDENEYTQS